MSTGISLGVGAAAAALVLDISVPAIVVLAGLALLALSLGLRATRSQTRRSRPLGLRPAACALAAVAIGLRALLIEPGSAQNGPLPTGDGPWNAIVISVGSPKNGTRPAVIELDGRKPITVAVTLPWYPEVAPADRIQVSGAIQPPPASDYATYLARVGAAGTLRASSLTVLPADGSPARWLEGLRRGAAAALDRAIPEPEAGLAAGILVGLRDRVDRDLAADFTTAGASHVVAISGWNIAIVATTLGALAGGLGRRRRAVLTGVAIAAYVLFVGPSPSVLRAGTMAGIALAARELGRPSRAAGAMGLAVAVLLLLNPGSIDDPGFRLSVLATAGLMAWGTPLARRLAGPAPGRIRAWLAESLGVSLAAQAATLPVILLEFGRLSLIAPVVNLGVVPLVAPAMGAGAVALVFGVIAGLGAPGAIATVGGLPAWVLLGAIVGMIRGGASVPLASVTLETPWDAIAAVAAAAGVVACARWGPGVLARRQAAATRPKPSARTSHRPRGATTRTPSAPGAGKSRTSSSGRPRIERAALVAVAGATLALGLALAHRPDGLARVVVLDVGQGDAILVEGSRGGRMLVDGGPDPTRLLIALDERLPPWDHRIDTLVLTHPHEDHAGGLAALLGRYRVGRIYEPGMIGPGPGYAALASELAHGGPPHGTLSTGDRLTLDDISFRVLWPDPGRVPLHPADGGTAINNVSIVLLGAIGAQRFLLAGDVEQGVDPELLARGLPHVDFLKVAHHGSGTASTQAFLDAVHPRVAAVSVGLGNPYGHPAPATIARLKSVARETYRTDLDGTVEVTFEGDRLGVRTGGKRRSADAPLPAAGALVGVVPAMALEKAPATPVPTVNALRFACSIVPRADAAAVAVARLPTVAEAPQISLGATSMPRPPIAGRNEQSLGAWHFERVAATRSRGAASLLYHRGDDGPLADGGGRVAPLPEPAGVARSAREGRGRSRGMAGGADLGARRPDRSTARRGCRAPP